MHGDFVVQNRLGHKKAKAALCIFGTDIGECYVEPMNTLPK